MHFTGRLNDATLVAALGGANGLVFVPWFEGFGVPVIEAMSCGVPVIASMATSLPEVCGERRLRWWIQDTIGSGQAMLRLSQDPQAAQNAVTRGLQRATGFSWTQTVDMFDAAVQTLLNDKQP